MGILTILIVKEAHAAKLSIVAGQMGYPQDFAQGRALCALGEDATPATPATHRLVHDTTMATGIEDNFRKMANGEYMPQVIWADIPGITETSAKAAAEALTVISEAGDLAGEGSLEEQLAIRGLKFIPEASFD